ncbi:MAG: hypothetical protein MOB07_16285 [Acidobacteria bacterium]|nr:hypothetical protein [Acidobacteriota bacterium]
MNAQSLLHDLSANGVRVYLAGDQLDVDAPDELLTDELLTTLKENKAELMEVLASHCPICHGPLCEETSKHFRHLWCPTPGHFDAWRAPVGETLSKSDAPILWKREGRE